MQGVGPIAADERGAAWFIFYDSARRAPRRRRLASSLWKTGCIRAKTRLDFSRADSGAAGRTRTRASCCWARRSSSPRRAPSSPRPCPASPRTTSTRWRCRPSVCSRAGAFFSPREYRDGLLDARRGEHAAGAFLGEIERAGLKQI